MQQNKGKLFAGCGLFAASFLLLFLARNVRGFAQWYSVSVYPLLVGIVGRICDTVSISVVEILLYIMVATLVASVSRLVIVAMKKKNIAESFGRLGMSVIFISGALFFIYTVNCGINYHRDSFSECIGLEIEDYTAEELKEVCVLLTQDINNRANEVIRDTSGCMLLPEKEQEIAVQAMEQLADEYNELKGYYPRPKGLMGSWLLSVQKLSGIYSPFTIEANYNQKMVDYNIPFTMCHELSHLRGFMQEQEANFIAYLACMESDNIEYQYSGSMLGWIHCTNALYKVDREAWIEVRKLLDESVYKDLQANNEFWAKYDGKTAEVADMINDNYLKANGQSDGVKSYDRMVDLLVAYYK